MNSPLDDLVDVVERAGDEAPAVGVGAVELAERGELVGRVVLGSTETTRA
jgi:hypothetical protein